MSRPYPVTYEADGSLTLGMLVQPTHPQQAMQERPAWFLRLGVSRSSARCQVRLLLGNEACGKVDTIGRVTVKTDRMTAYRTVEKR